VKRRKAGEELGDSVSVLSTRLAGSAHIVADAPERINVVAKCANCVVQALRRSPSKIQPVCSLSKSTQSYRVIQTDQTKVSQARAPQMIHQDVELSGLIT
jgi:hypothetical protein